jgi:cytochrome c553
MTALQASTVILLAGTAGCSNIERSRNLADPNVSGTTIARQVCSNCHGMDGNAVSPNFPNLAGQPKEYLATQLRQFRARTRTDQAARQYMWGLTRSLTDDQIEGLAAYFSARAPTAAPPAVRAASASSADGGQVVYHDGLADRNVPACAACHGEHGEGVAGMPRLAFQPADYTFRQLAAYRFTDERPDGVVMKAVIRGLEPADLRSVAEYLQAMPAAAPGRQPARESYASETPAQAGTQAQ